MKGVPPAARVMPFINKAESLEQLQQGRQMAKRLLQNDRIERVIIGALQSGRSIREIHRRITGVILAAGKSKRMGALKQLLPWGQTTVLGQTIDNLRRSFLHDVMVVSGYQAPYIEDAAKLQNIKVCRNEEHEHGGMISSLQTALRNLPVNQEAVLVMLADQPMIKTETIDTLVAAWFEGQGELIAPVCEGKRGNPVIFGRTHFEDLLSVSPGGNPREILRKREEDIRLIEVNDEAVLLDLDRMNDYEQWRPQSDVC